MVKVHKITGRHLEEVKLTAYVRRLDKIYAELGKGEMLPKVVKKMRTVYADNPHSFYLLVCRKYRIPAQKEIDAYAMVYGKTMFDKKKQEEDEEAEREAERLAKEIAETKEAELSEEEEEESESGSGSDTKSESKSEAKEEKNKSEMWPSTERYKPRMNVDLPDRRPYKTSYKTNTDSRYNYKMPEKRRTSPRANMEFSVNSPRAHYQYKRHEKTPVEKLDYVDVHPGDIVETMVLTGKTGNQDTGFWIPARVLRINEKNKTMDVQVLQPQKYGLAARAVKVPLKYVRSPASIKYTQM